MTSLGAQQTGAKSKVKPMKGFSPVFTDSHRFSPVSHLYWFSLFEQVLTGFHRFSWVFTGFHRFRILPLFFLPTFVGLLTRTFCETSWLTNIQMGACVQAHEQQLRMLFARFAQSQVAVGVFASALPARRN